MTYYCASEIGSNLHRIVVHPTLATSHITAYSTPEQARQAYGKECEIYSLEYDENYVADGKCFNRPGEYWVFSSVDVNRVE